MTYYGDLSKSYLDVQRPWLDLTNNVNQIAYGLSLENNFSKGMSWQIMATKGRFQASDRAIDWSGKDLATVENFNRGLNVQTDITNASFMFNFYSDNDWLLSEKSIIAPYFGIGAGLTWFTPRADLFLENGNRYHYWADGTIRDDDASNTNANIITQDGVFETDLAAVKTEQVDYATTTLSFPLALGIKFRLSERLNVNLEALLQYTMTDYLDDVSGAYPTAFDNPLQAYASQPGATSTTNRGTDNQLNDIYGMLSISAHYSFGYKMDAFTPPALYTINAAEIPPVSAEAAAKVENEEETVEAETVIVKVESADNVPIVLEENPKINEKSETVIVKKEKTATIKTEKAPTEEVVIIKKENLEKTVQEKEKTIISQKESGKTKIVAIDKKIVADTTVIVEIVENANGKRDTTITEMIVAGADTVKRIEVRNREKMGEVAKEMVIVKAEKAAPAKDKELVNVPKSQPTTDVRPALATVPDEDLGNNDVSVFTKIKKQVDSVASKPLVLNEPVLVLNDLELGDDETAAQTKIEAEAKAKKAEEKIKAETQAKADAQAKELAQRLEKAEQSDTEILLKVEESRAEVAQLTQELNKVLMERKVEKAEISTINQKLDLLTQALMNAQQYNNNVAIRGNNDYNDSSKAEIRTSTLELENEMSDIKKQLERANTDYAKALEYARANDKANQQKNENLDRKVRLLNAELKLEREKRKNAEKAAASGEVKKPKAFNPSRLDKTENDNQAEVAADTATVQSENEVAEKVLNDIVVEMEAEKAKAVAEKQAEVDSLAIKMTQLQKDFEAATKAKKAADAAAQAQKAAEAAAKKEAELKALEAKVEELTNKISKMESAKPKVVTVEKPVVEKVVVEKIVEKPVEKVITTAEAIRGYEISNVYFKVGQSAVSSEFYTRLETIASLMLMHPELTAVVTGFADKSGNPATNLKLSRLRSEAVSNFLKQQGVRSDRIVVDAFGATQSDKANDPLARRVEVKLIAK